MSVDTKLYLPQGINWNKLFDYLNDNYTEAKRATTIDHDCYTVMYFNDDEDQRILSVYIYHYDAEGEGYPCPAKPNVTTVLSLGCWGNSVKILEEIAQHFGGGFLLESDSAFADEDWRYVENVNNDYKLSDNEEKLYKLISMQRDGFVGRKEYEIAKFVLDHLDEICKLK